MGGTGSGPNVTPDQLSEPEQWLHELARAGTPLAEIAVRLGLSVAEADRRLDLLVMRLGLPDRTALRQPLPEPIIDATVAEEPDAVLPSPFGRGAGGEGPPVLSRRTLLIGGGAAASLAAVGAGAAWAFRGGDGEPRTVVVPGADQTPTPGAPDARSGLDLIEPISDAYQRRLFARGEEIDWPHGIFFMRTDSVKPDPFTGEVEAWRLRPPHAALDQGLISAYRLPGPRYIEALSQDASTRVLIDRDTGNAWRYPAALLRLTGARPHIASPAASERLLFAELDGAPGGPGQPTGRYVVADEKFALIREFQVTPVRFGSEPLMSATSDRVIVPGRAADAYVLHLFDPDDPSQDATLMLPLPPSGEVTISWLDEAVATPRDIFGFEVVVSGEGDIEPAVLRAFLPWSSNWPASFGPRLDAPRHVFLDPTGVVQLIQQSLRETFGQNLGGGENWPAIDVTTGEDAERIRSATLFYGDAIPRRRWTADGTWFFTMIASEATEGPGWDRVRYAAWRPGIGVPLLLELPPAPGSNWFYSTHNRGPIPHPTDPTLVALGRLEVARFNFSPGVTDPATRLTNHLVANVTSTSGPDHIDPWSGYPNELVFVVGHGGHDGGFPGAMITPAVEESPFDDDLRFVVARAGDCVNLRTGPSLDAEVRECLVDGTALNIWPAARGGPEDGVAFVRNEDGAWVAVALNAGSLRAGGALGWVSAAYLDWDLT